MLTIADILTRDVIRVSPGTSLASAASLMAKYKISCLIIADGAKPTGIITESDLVRAGSQHINVDEKSVGDFISHRPVTVEINQNVYEAFDFLIEHHIRHLVVVAANGDLEGLVTFTDVIRAAAFDDYLKAKAVVDEMSRNVATVEPDVSVLDVLALMDRLTISCVIINEKGCSIGIYTERDAASHIAGRQDLASLRVGDVMTSPIKTLAEQATLLEASICMRDTGIRRLVIVDAEGRASGIITQFDVIRGLEGQRVKHFKELHEKAEEKFLESQSLLAEKAELERILLASPAVLYRCIWQGGIEEGCFQPSYFSPQLESILGFTTDEFLQTLWWDTYVHPDDQESVLACLEQITVSGERELTYRVRSQSGSWVWILDHARVLKNSDGVPLEMIGSWLDVTAAKTAELKLQEHEQNLHSVVDNSFDGIAILQDEKLVWVNPAMEQIWGGNAVEMLGQSFLKFVDQTDRQAAAERYMQSMAGKKIIPLQLQLICRDDSLLWIEVSANLSAYKGAPAILLIVRNIASRRHMQDELTASEERYRSLFDDALDMMHITGLDGRIVDVNRAELAMLGYSRDEMLGMSVSEIVCSDAWVETSGEIRKVLGGESVELVQSIWRSKDGRNIPVEISASPQLEQGRVVAGRVIARDISAREIAEQGLKASEEKYRRLVESSNDAIFVADTETGIVIDANEQAEAMIGLTRNKLIGMHQSELHPPEQTERYQKIFNDNIHDERAFIPDLLVRRADGSDVPIDISANVTEVGGRKIVQAAFRDISERKVAEREIELAAERMKRVLDADFDAIVVHQDEKVVFSNRQAQALFGYASSEETIGEDVLSCFLPEQRSFAARIARRAIRTGKPVERLEMMGLSRVRPEPFPMEIASTPIQWAGKPAVVSIVRDITGRKQAQQQLENERASMRAMLNNLPFVAWLKDQDGAYLVVNENFAKLCGAETIDTLVGKTDFDLWPGERADAYRCDDQDVMDSGVAKHVEELAVVEDQQQWFETYKSPVFDADGKAVGTVGMAMDISSRMENEEQMRLLKSAVAAVNESIIITDVEGIIVYVNPSFTDNTGYTYEDALGETPAILNSKQQSEDFYQQFWKMIKDGRSWSGRILDRKKDGTIFPVHLSVAPIYDMEGVISHFVAVHEDLSESEAMQKKVMQSQKMEAVGTMVGGVAHDFNNLLASIVGNLYLMRNHHKDDEKTVKRIRGMEASVQHGAQLIQQMLTFARKDRTEMQSMDLKAFIKEAHRMAHASIPENIRFTLEYPSDNDFWVKGDATQLQQALLNLVTNAHHAVEDTDHPVISVELSKLEPDRMLLVKHAELAKHDGWCCLKCSDNGAGIDSGLLERVFEPFFTTKPVGEGTGLGLAMVYGAVQNHQGIIDISSELGSGTTVSIYLPLHRAESGNVVRQDEVAVDGQGWTVLLVDDETELRQVLADVLRHNGFTVLQASDGEQAVDMFTRHRSKITLVLMDVVMPNKGGVVAARDIREISDDVPIIFQTGYGEQTQLDAAAAIGNSESLQKPVQIPQLMKMIVAKIQSKEEGGNEL